jgi:hypothetical protein
VSGDHLDRDGVPLPNGPLEPAGGEVVDLRPPAAGPVGGELADTGFRLRRRVRAEDPADLGAPLSYRVEVLAGAEDEQDLEPAAAALSKSRQWVLAALRAGGELQTVKQLGTPSSLPAASPADSSSQERVGWCGA